jgi:cytidine deaminase
VSDPTPAELVQAAAHAAEAAHAPYSHYQVGAALLTEDGQLFTGCNVENASYGLTNCAERTAVFTAVAAGHKRFRAVAIVARGESIPYPCGACRQVLAEFCPPECPVHVARQEDLDTIETSTLAELLPKSFRF